MSNCTNSVMCLRDVLNWKNDTCKTACYSTGLLACKRLSSYCVIVRVSVAGSENEELLLVTDFSTT